MKIAGIIPARYASTRFPGKPLADIGGQSLIERVYRQVRKTTCIQEVVVATDDERILRHVLDFGGQAVMTRSDHASGTDRCAEVAEALSGFDIVVNIQGDEPFIRPEQIEAALVPLLHSSDAGIATLAKKMDRREDVFNPNVVKVVFNERGRALYFSRSPIPYLRGIPEAEWPGDIDFYKHIGLYAFRREVLSELTRLPMSAHERAESLEQLRWLDAGYAIAVSVTPFETIGVDTPEDVARALLEGLGQ
ncbi:MAG: 3-deoxy-manno-octulosonate cytidylyltransferase [Saprospiraceae bacterium]|nr:3-deoxy-manno-octulosonate cytidylyltransferase [Saprospiraceae bacterium]